MNWIPLGDPSGLRRLKVGTLIATLYSDGYIGVGRTVRKTPEAKANAKRDEAFRRRLDAPHPTHYLVLPDLPVKQSNKG